MRIVKGLIALLLTAWVVFSAVVFYNSKTEPAYEAKLNKVRKADTIVTEKAEVAAGIKPAPANPVVRQKTKNANL